jgi:hypothetical protein
VSPTARPAGALQKHLKLRFEFDDTHKLFGIPRDPECDVDILGAIFFDEARIVIDESLDPEENPAKEGRFRFALVHEGGGHWRLHRHLFAKDPTQAALFGGPAPPSIVCRSSQAKERVEWQADFYASCLLMPRKLIFETWRERFGTTAPFIFEINKSNPIFAPRRSNWIHISRAFETAPDTLRQPDYQIVFNIVAREFAQFSAFPQRRCASALKNWACCSAKFRISGRSRSVLTPFFGELYA